MPDLDTRAWLVWLGCSLALLFLLDHPAVDLMIIAVAGVVAWSGGRPSSFRTLLIVGAVILVVRTVLFALTGHAGNTTLFELPQLHLPALLGGTTLGGRVTAEVVAAGALEGLRIVAVMACFGAFLSVTETAEMLRLLPRFLFEAGLVMSIAMAFAPSLARSARDIREAQAMRGAGRRLAPTVVPVIASALERSTTLAESMDSRGYGRAEDDLRAEGRLRAAAAVAALAVTSALALWAMGRGTPFSGIAALAAGGIFLLALRRLSALVPRTRYRHRRFAAPDAILSGASLLALGVALILVRVAA